MMLRAFVGACLLSTSVLVQAAFAADARSLQVIVSKNDQSLSLYEDGELVATSKVSTGKAGHDTPSGIFSILDKRKYHESNIYSAAPMPFMQRLTWSGIALHEGHVPNYPASHGCIRLPAKFAKALYGMTGRGVHVIISDAAIAPRRIEHPALLQFKDGGKDGLMLSDVELRPANFDSSLKLVEVAVNQTTNSVTTKSAPRAQTPPLRILITRRGEREKVMDVQRLLTSIGFDAGVPDGYSGQMTVNAINAFKRWKNLKTTGPLVSDDMVDALYASAGAEAAPNAQIMVRQNFKPLFEAPIHIKDPQVALGTHFFEVIDIDHDSGKAEWNGLTLENHLPTAARKRLGIDVADAPGGSDQLSAVLDRIDIPADIRTRLESELSTGSSITVSDLSHGLETGQGTDFITITRDRSI
ncbi:L,D-transpeptidase family protein [Agrobacterium sp. rho-13.3]|uniref:L,D-transpeptidase family protein n=1 Tax=Agrobacterium sp. rho-13.3 TaxID=3072980 RepID=UPI002A13ED8E|nr:L,D-transpeptidase family protein [Agrobacterium sp. rho-13.3]MDX8311778.1 L,D-transpeptidase family protein [Agrobacterium sp. rho-13.3]